MALILVGDFREILFCVKELSIFVVSISFSLDPAVVDLDRQLDKRKIITMIEMTLYFIWVTLRNCIRIIIHKGYGLRQMQYNGPAIKCVCVGL